jgi:riboflavin synthase
MFTGIIETTGRIQELSKAKKNRTFWIESAISSELQVDQSVSHNGVCLTVEEIRGNAHRVTAIAETLKKTNLSDWKIGGLVNLERCLPLNGRLDGHIVQGHADATGICRARKETNGSWQFRIEFPGKFSRLVIEKGSISLNGISLTVFQVRKRSFTVAIIPYTFEHTNIKNILSGEKVNLEFDMIGKYIARFLEMRLPSRAKKRI